MEERDNWLVGKEWYKTAIDAVDNKGQSLGRKSPRDFYSSPAKSEMNYAEAIEEEGYFEKGAPRLATSRRRMAAVRRCSSSSIRPALSCSLGTQKQLEKELADLRAKLDAMSPEAR